MIFHFFILFISYLLLKNFFTFNIIYTIIKGLIINETMMWFNKFTKENIEDDEYVIYYNLKDLDQMVTIEPNQNNSTLSNIENDNKKNYDSHHSPLQYLSL